MTSTLRWFLGLGADAPTRLSAALRLGGLAVLAVVGSLGGLWLMPALAAAVHTDVRGDHLVRRWWASLLNGTPQLWRWQVLFVAAVVVGVADVAYAASFGTGVAPWPAQVAMVAGLVVLLLAAVLAPLVTVAVGVGGENWPAGRVLAAASSSAFTMPLRTVGLVALTLLTGVLAVTAWPLAPLALGALVLALRAYSGVLTRWTTTGVAA